jgi:hypothetical protein
MITLVVVVLVVLYMLARVALPCVALVHRHLYHSCAMGRARGYASIAPCDGHAASPPRSPFSSGSDTDRVDLQPLLSERHFWNNEMNSLIMRAAANTSYRGNFTCVATGLHVSNFQLDHAACLDRLQKIVHGTLPRSSVLAAPWRRVDMHTLAGVVRVLHALDEAPDGHLDLLLLTRVFFDGILPDTFLVVASNTLQAVAQCAPVMMVSTGATAESLGERLHQGERLIFHRPSELLPVLSIYLTLGKIIRYMKYDL